MGGLRTVCIVYEGLMIGDGILLKNMIRKNLKIKTLKIEKGSPIGWLSKRGIFVPSVFEIWNPNGQFFWVFTNTITILHFLQILNFLKVIKNSPDVMFFSSLCRFRLQDVNNVK